MACWFGRGAGVEHVALALLALVLHGVEEHAVQLLEHRQHRLARHRRPAAEHGRDLFLGDQLARLFREQRPVGGRIDDHGFELLAEQTALLVLLLDQHQHDVLERRLADGHRARQRMQDAYLDGVLRPGLIGRRKKRARGQQRRRCGSQDRPSHG